MSLRALRTLCAFFDWSLAVIKRAPDLTFLYLASDQLLH
jgi:hypothetical protein